VVDEITGEHRVPYWIVCAGTKSGFTTKQWPVEYYQAVVLFGDAIEPDLTSRVAMTVCRGPGILTADRGWLLFDRQIVDHVNLSHRTVERPIRQAAVLDGRWPARIDTRGV